MGRLSGRVAIVTGAGSGIGKGIVRRFAAEGASILIAELNAETGQQVTEAVARDFSTPVAFLQTDVCKKDAVDRMVAHAVDRFGKLDILVNNAWGGGSLARLEYKTDDQMQHGMLMAFWSGYWGMQAAFPHMKAQRWGRIVSICSLNGVNAHQFTAEYNSGKEALRAVTRTAAREWARHGICANIICPAALTASSERVAKTNPEIFADVEKANPMGRMGDPEADIAPVAAFLASEDCRYLTGNTLFVDGGSHINGSTWNPDLPD